MGLLFFVSVPLRGLGFERQFAAAHEQFKKHVSVPLRGLGFERLWTNNATFSLTVSVPLRGLGFESLILKNTFHRKLPDLEFQSPCGD